MTVYVPAPAGAAPEGLAVVTLLALVFLVFQKAISTYLSTTGHLRLAQSLDVALVPLGVGWIALAVSQVGRLAGGGS